MSKWCDKEEEYLHLLHESCDELSREYMKLYIQTLKMQTRLRLPTIVLSSVSGVASFGTSTFPESFRNNVSIVVGVINIGIAIVQTYESYLKIADTVAHSLSASKDLKKLADDIHCEIFIPIEDRISNGVIFLREAFGRYQAILETAPPLQNKTDRSIVRRSDEIKTRLSAYAARSPAAAPEDAMIEIRTTPFVESEQSSPAGPSSPGNRFRSGVKRMINTMRIT
jgi:hypothetical protein